ncbi:MAG: efflux transporter periplasmic adaptor subunit, partial [Thermoanaerobaculia bacterium]
MMFRVFCFLAALGPATAMADHDTTQAAMGADGAGAGAVDHGAHDHGAETIKLTPAQSAASRIAVMPASAGPLSRRLTVPGTITLDTDRIVRA